MLKSCIYVAQIVFNCCQYLQSAAIPGSPLGCPLSVPGITAVCTLQSNPGKESPKHVNNQQFEARNRPDGPTSLKPQTSVQLLTQELMQAK